MRAETTGLDLVEAARFYFADIYGSGEVEKMYRDLIAFAANVDDDFATGIASVSMPNDVLTGLVDGHDHLADTVVATAVRSPCFTHYGPDQSQTIRARSDAQLRDTISRKGIGVRAWLSRLRFVREVFVEYVGILAHRTIRQGTRQGVGPGYSLDHYASFGDGGK